MEKPTAAAPADPRQMRRAAIREIGGLPNLGPKSKAMLAETGVDSIEALRALGAVAAYARVRRDNPRASLNLLWALEGALTGVPWQEVARRHRTSLLLALDALETGR